MVAVDEQEVERLAAERRARPRERLRRVRVAADQVQPLRPADEAAVQRDLPGGVAAAELAPRQVDADDRRGAVGGESKQEERAAAGGADLEQPPRPRPLRRDRLEQAEHLGTHLAARELDAERRERERNVDKRLQVGRDLEAHVPVTRLRPVVHRPQDVGRALDVLDGQLLVDGLGPEAGVLRDLLDGVLVVVAAVDRVGEDGGVRGDAAQTVVVDKGFELTFADKATRDKVEPDALAGRA